MLEREKAHVFQLANVTGTTQQAKKKCAAAEIRNLQADVHVEPLEDESLPDQLINPEEYKPPCHTPQGHTTTDTLMKPREGNVCCV